ncbi:NADPH-dependent FMN reductase [Nonomuraea sp. JJY05]|jgi:NAD(P)H-dependent FMN reductase|uniref:NADPH-dependent FMN reductase n=1 Tax=Nonomuraea sp. JJY05 TaxID=3350255 RepID=UPI00373EAF2D
MIDVAIIMGSTRPGRHGEAVAGWVHDLAVKRGDARFEVVDLADFTVFRPAGRHEDTLTTLLDQVLAWSAALKPLRTGERCEA